MILESFLNWKVRDDPNWKKTLPFGAEISWESLAKSVLVLAPDLFIPVAEVATNYDTFRGRPIVSNTRLAGEDQQYLLYNRWTTESAKWVGRKINYSPAMLDHIWEGYWTGVARMATKQTDRVIGVISGQQSPSVRTSADIPFGELGVRAFYGGHSIGRANIDEFYEAYESLNGTAASVRSLYREKEYEEARRIASASGLSITTRRGVVTVTSPVLRRLRSGVSSLRDTRTALVRIDNMVDKSPEELRARRNDIVLKQVNIARRALGLPRLTRPTSLSFFRDQQRLAG
tara:strand:+ start:91 stop:954 length:864 start_codon:yes stop_codon:yes gene_type:complete